MAAQQRNKSNRRSRRAQTQIPLMIFPTAWEAAEFLRTHPQHDPSRVQYSEDPRPGFFPETITEFESRDQALEYLEEFPYSRLRNGFIIVKFLKGCSGTEPWVLLKMFLKVLLNTFFKFLG